MFFLGMQRCAHAADNAKRVSLCSLYSLLVELAWKEAAAAGKQEEAGEGYAVPFIRAISDTSPTRKLNVTFLRTCAIEPLKMQALAEDNGQRRTTAAASVSARCWWEASQ